jgi:hypothetical protein
MEHMGDLSLESLGVPVERPSVIKRLRDHHHLVARLVAEGKRTSEIATETGLCISRVSILKGDPAFKQLVEMYRANLEQLANTAYFDMHRKYALLEANGVDHMNERYEDEPENISHEQARADAELAATMLGRKVTKSFNVNATATIPLAETLEARKRRALQLSAREPGSVDASPTTPAQDKD